MDSQPATQLYHDPRRLGRNISGLTEADLSDVLCILDPNSNAAIKLVAALAKVAPQHILQNEDLLDAREQMDPGTTEQDPEISGAIALRMSSDVKDIGLGFVFGRTPAKCDILLCQDEKDFYLSQQHFRIYVNSEQSLMIQDMSTNGIYYDEVFLTRHVQPKWRDGRQHQADNGDKRMITSGGLIRLLAGDGRHDQIRFTVRIPSRTDFEGAYQWTLQEYLGKIYEREHDHRHRQLVRVAGGLFPDIPTPPIFKPPPAYKSTMTPRNHLPRHWDGGPKYNVVGMAGKGAFATVWRIASRREGAVFAAKEISKKQFFKNGVFDSKLDSELNIMQGLRHSHIVQYIEHFEDPAQIYIVMEYVPGGDLSSLIAERGALPEEWVKLMGWQTLLALRYLHKRRISHRDVKPDNILIVSEEPVNVKISDFGLSKVIDNHTVLKTFCGTLLYCAPEVFSKYPNYLRDHGTRARTPAVPTSSPHFYDQACDTWSYAGVLYMAMSGKPPYPAETGDRDSMLDKIMMSKLSVEPLRRHRISTAGIAFVRKLLNIRPRLRPTDEQCVRDEWYSDLPASCKQAMHEDDGVDERETVANFQDALEVEASQLRITDDSNNDNYDDDNDLDADLRPQNTTKYLPHLRGEGGPEAQGRLFGEVGTSAMGSSGVIPDNLRLNLGPEVDANRKIRTNVNATAKARVNTDVKENAKIDLIFREAQAQTWAQDISPTDVVPSSQPVTPNQHPSPTHDSPQDHQISQHAMAPHSNPNSAAPSLFGAEALVRGLNVDSPSTPSSVAAHSVPSTPQCAALARSNAPSALDSDDEGDLPTPSMKRPRSPDSFSGAGDTVEPSVREDQPRPAKFTRRITLPIPDSYYYDPYDRRTHNAEHAAKMRALDIARAGGRGMPGAASFAAAPTTTAPAEVVRCSASFAPGDTTKTGMPPPPPTGSGPRSGTEAGPVSGDNPTSSSKPILGSLSSTPTSFHHPLTIELRERETSWGRSRSNSIIYPHPLEVRVPKYGFDIIFWSPQLATHLATGADWTSLPSGCPAVIKTRTKQKIWINSVELVHELPGDSQSLDDASNPAAQAWNPYGIIHTGDVITICKEDKTKKGLQFLCTFFHGPSARPRPVDDKGFHPVLARPSADGDLGGKSSLPKG